MNPQIYERSQTRRPSVQILQLQQTQIQSSLPQQLQDFSCLHKKRPKSQPRFKVKQHTKSSLSTPNTPLHANRDRPSFSIEAPVPLYYSDNEYNSIHINNPSNTGNSNTRERESFLFSSETLDFDAIEDKKRTRQARTFCWFYLQSSLTTCQRRTALVSPPATTTTTTSEEDWRSSTSSCQCPYLHLDKNNSFAVRYAAKQLQKIEKYLSYAAHGNKYYLSAYTEFIQKYGRCLSEIESLPLSTETR